ncbi:hypothetical protein [Endozoicomonas sp. GU-1]|nr:hypothetical protein [Endozoicomonas sp. GU-1]WBA81231.1 hypothetical protein O2T12_23540 [Endozoicomonas sp. GU-1]WBA84179.1 hypothetical protein O3276_12720 [Endozoicomonas sp. GU-1]
MASGYASVSTLDGSVAGSGIDDAHIATFISIASAHCGITITIRFVNC